MGTGKNWEKYGRKQRMAHASSRYLDGPKLNDVFKALNFKNYHRSKTCAIKETNFSKSAGDRLFRVTNEVVEMLVLTLCAHCKFTERF